MGALFSTIPALFGFLASPVWSVVIVGGLAFFGGHHLAVKQCNEREAAAQAALIRARVAEAAREEKARHTIAVTDSLRLSASKDSASAMQAEIDRLRDDLAKRASSHAKTKFSPCAIDSDFTRRVRDLDAAGNR